MEINKMDEKELERKQKEVAFIIFDFIRKKVSEIFTEKVKCENMADFDHYVFDPCESVIFHNFDLLVDRNNKGLLRVVLWELKMIKSEAEHSKCNNLHYNNLISDLDNLIGKIKDFLIRSTLKERYFEGTLIENQENKQDNNND